MIRIMSSKPHHNDEPRRGRHKKLTAIAVVLMLLALVGYVLSLDEELAPGSEGERMPAAAE